MSRYANLKHYVYQIKFPDNKRYIGCTRNLHQRINTHATSPNKSLKLYMIVTGYSFFDAEFSVIEVVDEKSKGISIERHFQHKFYEEGLLVNGYNPKKKREIFKIKLPNGETESIGIIKKSIFKPEQLEMEARNAK